MTAPTEDVRTAESSKPEPEGAFVDFLDLGPADPPAEPAAHHRSLWWRIGFPLALLALVASVPALVYAGYRVVLQSHNGRLIQSTTDPSEPGWEAAVEPTATGVLATTTDQGQLSSVSLLALTSDGSGTVIFVPADTQIPNLPNYQTMVDAYAAGGPAGLKSALEAVLALDVGEVTVATSANWEELVAPVGTITIANPDSVEVNGVVLPRGSIDLAPAQVGAYLRARNYAEDDTNRLLRQEAFWQAWLTKVAAAGTPDAVPGESETGVGRFVRTLAGDQVVYSVLPVKRQSRPDAYSGVFVPITSDVTALIARAVPFPTAAPPGSRPRIRVLDGTGQLDHGVIAATSLAANGAQIDAIGNASNFEVPTTQFIINDEGQRVRADQLRAALGVGEVVVSGDTNDSVDITVILGADARDLPSTQGAGVGAGAGPAGGTSSATTAGTGG